MSSPKGYPTDQKKILDAVGMTNKFTTVQPSADFRAGMDTVSRGSFRVGSSTVPRTVEANSTKTYINDTATVASVGDFIRFESGASNEFAEMAIVSVDTNGFALGGDLKSLPTVGDEFYIMRYITPRMADDGSSLVSITPSPISYRRNALSQEVLEDTSTPGNSRPLPVVQFNTSGSPFNAATAAKQDAQSTLIGDVAETAPATDIASSGLNGRLQRIAQRITSLINLFPSSIGQKASAGSLSVVLASDQASLPTKSPVNTNGSQSDVTLTGTTASTATAPANAVGFILQAVDTNANNIRWRVGGTASTSSGMQLQPGRDSGFVPVAADVSVCAEASSGTNAFQIQWILSQ